MSHSSLASAFVFFLFVQAVSVLGQEKLSGDWKGAIDIQGMELVILTHFSADSREYQGTIDVPQQGGQDIPLQNIRVAEDSVHFEFMAGLSMATFKGAFKNDTTISGTFHQNGGQFPFHLTKKPEPKSDVVVAYTENELIINNDSLSIGGTLTTPKNQNAEKLVIIISGSGAQNRDGEIPITDFKPYAALAESLSANGIATFRYDDRGVGKSTGSFSDATLSMLASDVRAIVNHFTQDPTYPFSGITLLGHSQGGAVAGKVAAEDKLIDKLILLGSAGQSLKQLLRFQVWQAFSQANVDSSLIAEEISGREQLMEAVLNNQDIKEAKDNYRNQFKAVQLSLGMDSSQATTLANQQANQLAMTFQSPQVKSLLNYNPATDLQKLTIPVLILIGDKDTQVPADMNRTPIESALDSARVTYKTTIFPNANHLFQKAETGMVQEYAALDDKFVERLIPTLTDWITQN